MTVTRDTISFTSEALGMVADAMRALSSDGVGKGWINISAELSAEEAARVPQRSAMSAWLSGRGPALAMATWVPGTVLPRRRLAQIGIEHGTGPDALTRLRSVGIVLPDAWLRRQDHARNGLVVDLPDNAEPEVVISWAVAATQELQTVIKSVRRWTAVVHHPG